jgi:hypothetical protein
MPTRWPYPQRIIGSRSRQRLEIALNLRQPCRAVLWIEDREHSVVKVGYRRIGVGSHDGERLGDGAIRPPEPLSRPGNAMHRCLLSYSTLGTRVQSGNVPQYQDRGNGQ